MIVLCLLRESNRISDFVLASTLLFLLLLKFSVLSDPSIASCPSSIVLLLLQPFLRSLQVLQSLCSFICGFSCFS